MSARRFAVSFTTGPLTDREVDALADVLWDHGAGTITFRPLVGTVGGGGRNNVNPSLDGAENVAEGPSGHGSLGTSPPAESPYKPERHSRADSTVDRDALRAAAQHDVQRSLKW